MDARGTEVDRGRLAKRPGDLPRVGWIDIALRIKDEIAQDNLSMLAAGAAFYALLALFPGIAAVVSVYGLFTGPQTVAEHMQALGGILPEQARTILDQQLQMVTTADETALGFAAVVAFLLAVWSSSKGVKALITALNVVYDEQEKRGFFRLNVVSLLLTSTLLLVVLTSLAAVAVLPVLVERLGLPPLLEGALRWLRWPVLAALSVAAMAILYRHAPSRARAQWSWVLWGAVAATALWLIGSGLFSWYVSNFGSYNETYGSVAAVVVLMMWFYLSAYFVLIGGEVNAEMEHQTRHDTTAGRPLPMGERGAYVADTLGRARGDRAQRTG
jgi:membrane protein